MEDERFDRVAGTAPSRRKLKGNKKSSEAFLKAKKIFCRGDFYSVVQMFFEWETCEFIGLCQCYQQTSSAGS